MSTESKNSWWNLELEGKPDFEMAMKRIYAWYEGEIIDRPPVRFSSHNAEFETANTFQTAKWRNLKDRWFDEEYQVEKFIKSIEGKRFLAETFPVFWPNLGPNVYAAFYGAPLTFGEVTSWAEPILESYDHLAELKFNPENEYFKKLESMTRYALERCPGKFMVGYTDLHPGLDCAAALRGTENFCMDLYDRPVKLKELIELSSRDFPRIFNHFDAMLKEKKQLSVSWMNIPSFGKMHIPSCDFSALISTEQFIEYNLPVLRREVSIMDHNIFHLDGKGAARHLDLILEVPEIHAVQWVQGVGDDKPIMQWIPLIKRIRSAGKSVVVDLDKTELEDFIAAMEPEGLFLCIASESEEEEKEILKRIEKW